jgi:Skp family chaperone for outer membrane proteins
MPTVVSSGMEASLNPKYGRVQTTPPLTSSVQKDEKSTKESSYDLKLSQKARTLQREHTGKQEELKQQHSSRKQKLEAEYQQKSRQLELDYEQKKRSISISLYA